MFQMSIKRRRVSIGVENPSERGPTKSDDLMFKDHDTDTEEEGNLSKSDDARHERLMAVQMHPLTIPHITENIMTRLSISSNTNQFSGNGLKSYRLVCKSWNEIVKKLIRRESDDLVFGENDKSDTKKMRKFLEDMENSEDIPNQKYRFDPGFFVKKNAELFKYFLYSCGSSIVILKLWFDNECTMAFAKRCYSDLRLESLQYLFFGCVNYRGKASTENLELTYVLEAFLNASTNLQKFCFSFPPKDFKSQKVIISRFGDLIGSKVPKSVKNLKIEMKITDSQLNSLRGLALSLDTLHCDFRGSKLSRGVLHSLFEQQKYSLQEMRLLDSEMKYDFELEFPVFLKLTVLEIQGGNVLPFSYKDHFPLLERLILFGWQNINTLPQMLDGSSSCQCLKSLELPYKITDVGLIYLASKCFPNLKKLEISPTAEGLKALTKVFECMTGLEQLEITFPFVIEELLNVDPVFTGIPEEDCVRILESGEMEAVDINEVQKSPSITNLTKLERLIIQDHSSEIRLSDITAHFAFLKLDSIKYMEIGQFQISDRVFELLSQKANVPPTFDSDSDSSSCDLGSDSSDEETSSSSSSEVDEDI